MSESRSGCRLETETQRSLATDKQRRGSPHVRLTQLESSADAEGRIPTGFTLLKWKRGGEMFMLFLRRDVVHSSLAFFVLD